MSTASALALAFRRHVFHVYDDNFNAFYDLSNGKFVDQFAWANPNI